MRRVAEEILECLFPCVALRLCAYALKPAYNKKTRHG